MIASVRGRVSTIGPDGVVVEVGGVGLAISCAPSTIAGLRVGEEARLATSLIVREDSLTLYGFANDDARHLFDLLQTASGIGPRIAQAALAIHNPDVLRRAIATADVGTLTRVPGIGKKGAEKMVLELRDRIGPVGADTPTAAAPLAAAWHVQVREGLIGLGWTPAQAEQAVATVAEGVGDEPPPVPVLLKQAIRLLGTNR